MPRWSLSSFVGCAALLLLINTAYIAVAASPTVFYMANVLLHVVGGGVAVGGGGGCALRRQARGRAAASAQASALGAHGGGRARRRARSGAATSPRCDGCWSRTPSPAASPSSRCCLSRGGWRPRRRAASDGSGGRTCRPRRLLAAVRRGLAGRRRPTRGVGSHREPADAAGVDGRGGRRPDVAVLPLVGPNQRRRHDSVGLLHGLGTVRRLPQGHLRAVEELGPPLRLVQQPVLPEVHRVHADRSSARGRASGAPAATITRSSSTAASSGRSTSRSTRRKRRRAWPARPATPSRTWTAPWATAGSPSSIRRCTSSPRAASRWSARWIASSPTSIPSRTAARS